MSGGWSGVGGPAAGAIRRPNAELRVDRAAHPGWVSCAEREPVPGDAVMCPLGPGQVAAVRGRTGDGSRLLEIRLDDPAAPPYFAAASNVLRAPAG